MPQYRASLQTLGAIVLLALALACHGKGGSANGDGTTATISGTVMYQRVPLVKNANGVPIGLAAPVTANLVSLPAQGVYIRIYQQVAQTAPDGSTVYEWVLAGSTTTTTTGTYSTTVATGRPTMVELLSTFSGGSGVINLIAEPQGISSPTPVYDRVQYAMRAAADGSKPANNKAPATVISGNSVVNFTVGLNDVWWVYNPSITSSTGVAAFVDQAKLETDPSLGAGRTSGLGAGSRVLGIGDTIASFVTVYGAATPGSTLDLHYWPGVDSGGSYVVYDRSLIPQSLASSVYFGTLRGGPSNDDAWDAGVILPLLARNVLYGANLARTFSVSMHPLFPPSAALADLSPDMARIEGLAQAMAANVLQSPYLADTQDTGLAAPVIDIRDISGLSAAQLTPYSAPAIRRFAWEVILKANSLPSPGTASDWANINTLTAARFFLTPAAAGTSSSGAAVDVEPLNIYNQIGRLKEAKTSIEPVDLATIFTDAVLTSLGQPFGLLWPRPITGAYTSFAANWGTDPTTSFPPVVLSMAKATQVNPPFPGAVLAYPNLSQGEVVYAGFSLSADKSCTMTATITSLGAPFTGQVEVDLPMIPWTFTFTGSGETTARMVIPVSSTAPYYHPVRIRMVSPSLLQPPVTVALTLNPSN